MSEDVVVSQDEVTEWFDSTYELKGFQYLRPLEAYPIFLQLLGARPGQELLDVACGPGHLLKAASLRGVRPTGVDVSARALDLASRYVPDAVLHEGNAESLPFADESFDLVTCIGAIERFLDRGSALAEMRRVARPGARFCFMVRNASTLAWRLWRIGLRRRNVRGHQDALALEEWRTLLEGCGFEVLAVHMDQWARQRLRRVLRGFRRPDLTRDEPVARPLLSLRFANEFIFVLRRREARR